MDSLPRHDMSTPRKRVAVIGSGISGLSAAWLLSRSMDVTLYEAERRPGGHSNTVDVEDRNGAIPVDTGFIVFNDHTYPNLVALFAHLGVETHASDMSFAASLEDGGFEYSGSGLSGLLSQKTNALKPRFWSMVSDIVRFYKEAPTALAHPDAARMTLGDYLQAGRYGRAFINDHLLPMGAAIWSTTAADMRSYPLEAFVRFFQNHGLLLLKDRPVWKTVRGGSREYVRRLLEDFRGLLRYGSPVVALERDDLGVTVRCADGHADRFNEVVIATHANHALAMLKTPSDEERTILGAFGYTANRAVLHSDTRLMPVRRSAWASWNYIGSRNDRGEEALCVTYWMNRLQGIVSDKPLFVTLNPSRNIDPAKIHREFHYEHPLFDTAAMEAQRRIWALQGQRHTWFCGAHFGSGFHEDGLQAGLAVAEQLGGLARPWNVANPSGRIFCDALKVAAE